MIEIDEEQEIPRGQAQRDAIQDLKALIETGELNNEDRSRAEEMLETWETEQYGPGETPIGQIRRSIEDQRAKGNYVGNLEQILAGLVEFETFRIADEKALEQERVAKEVQRKQDEQVRVKVDRMSRL